MHNAKVCDWRARTSRRAASAGGVFPQPVKAQGIATIARLTLQVPRRRLRWANIPGIGPASARDIEAFFSHHPALTESTRQFVERFESHDHVAWRQLLCVRSLDGSRGRYCAPKARCLLDAVSDREAIEDWLALRETDATSRGIPQGGGASAPLGQSGTQASALVAGHRRCDRL
ncbi:phage integrase family protein [Paraburkholderia sp. BR10882]|uniref:phage integrase family protein n=1 Tax=unclassified Paraburkholderia TaxID=2615204 RepID=UPI0034CE35DA